MMANAETVRVRRRLWLAGIVDNKWTCIDTQQLTTTPWPSSYHFGCQSMTIPSGEKDYWFNTGRMENAAGARPQTPYVDFLRPLEIDPSCTTGIAGPDEFLVPTAERADYFNTWVTMQPLKDFPSKRGSNELGCAINWSTGNWFTMGSPDTYLARLEGTILDAPAGSIAVFHFPEGSPETEKSFEIPPANPDNPTCLGTPVTISEPFVINPEHDPLEMELMVPEACATLREGTTVQFVGKAVGDADSPEYADGEFIVGHAGTCVVDNLEPVIEEVTLRTQLDGTLDVRVRATDPTTFPLTAFLNYLPDGGISESVLMGFEDNPVRGDTVYFQQIIGPFPNELQVDVGVDVFDDANTPSADTMMVITSIEGNLADETDGFMLHQNYPNPFATTTTLQFNLTAPQRVVIDVYDLLGRRVTTLVDAPLGIGTHEVSWNAETLPSGMYFFKMQAGSFEQVRKALRVK